MSEAIVRANSMEFNGHSYFRVGSEKFNLGCIGEKRSPIMQGNYLDVSDRVKAGKLKVKKLGPLHIDAQRSNQADFKCSVSMLKAFKLASSHDAYKRVVSHELELCYVEAEEQSLKQTLNNAPRLLESLKRWGDDARVGRSGFVILHAESAKSFTASHEGEAEFTIYGLTFKPQTMLAQSGHTEIEFPVGMYFSYGMDKVVWDTKKPKDGHRIVDLVPDWHGI